jgi:hypothetical protein
MQFSDSRKHDGELVLGDALYSKAADERVVRWHHPVRYEPKKNLFMGVCVQFGVWKKKDKPIYPYNFFVKTPFFKHFRREKKNYIRTNKKIHKQICIQVLYLLDLMCTIL